MDTAAFHTKGKSEVGNKCPGMPTGSKNKNEPDEEEEEETKMLKMKRRKMRMMNKWLPKVWSICA